MLRLRLSKPLNAVLVVGKTFELELNVVEETMKQAKLNKDTEYLLEWKLVDGKTFEPISLSQNCTALTIQQCNKDCIKHTLSIRSKVVIKSKNEGNHSKLNTFEKKKRQPRPISTVIQDKLLLNVKNSSITIQITFLKLPQQSSSEFAFQFVVQQKSSAKETMSTDTSDSIALKNDYSDKKILSIITNTFTIAPIDPPILNENHSHEPLQRQTFMFLTNGQQKQVFLLEKIASFLEGYGHSA